MKRFSHYLLISLCLLSCLSCRQQVVAPETYKNNEMQLITDSLSAPAINYIKKQAKEDLEKRLIMEVPFKIDSVIKLKHSLLYVDTAQK